MIHRNVHILAGEPSLLLPKRVAGQNLADLCGANLKSVPAEWLSPQAGHYAHDFLAEMVQDKRIALFARSLITDHARGPEPLLVVPALVDAPHDPQWPDRMSWPDVLRILQEEGAGFGYGIRFHLHLLTLSPGTGASVPDSSATGLPLTDSGRRLGLLQSWLSSQGIVSERGRVVALQPDSGGINCLQDNCLAWSIVPALDESLQKRGLVLTDRHRLAWFVSDRLDLWTAAGLRPAFPPSDSLIAGLAEAVLQGITGFSDPTRKDAS